jgi:sugar lactone lactonase YvrE
VTIIADSYGGKRLNSANDVVPHPDGTTGRADASLASASRRRSAS